MVFVVGSGFVTLRNPDEERVNIGRGVDTLEKWRALHKAAELEYLEEILGYMRATKRKSRKPSWLLVALTKIDLFYTELAEARSYYSPHGNSRFSKLLNEFQANVGRDNIEWDAVPVCSRLDSFMWNGKVVASQLDTNARDFFTAQTLKRMGELCQA